MREYETTFIVQPEIGDEGCQELFGRIDGALEKAGATRLLHADQGKRRLAYEIRKFQKGRYVTTFYLSTGEAVAPLEQMLRIEESVLRFLTVLKNEKVLDVEARRVEAAEEEKQRAERALERARREAEEAQSREQAARAAATEAAADAKFASESNAASADDAASEAPADETVEAAEPPDAAETGSETETEAETETAATTADADAEETPAADAAVEKE